MPQPEKLTAPPSRDFCKSEEGLWVKGERDARGVHIYFQPRTRVEAGCLVELDANGEEVDRQPMLGASYPEPWRLVGTLEPTATIVEVAGLQDFDWFQFGVLRHAVRLIAGGWGDDPEEVMGWFADLRDGDWIRGGQYRLVGPERGPFRDLGGVRLLVDDRFEATEEERARRVLTGMAQVGVADEFPFEFPLDEVLAAFTIATVPG